MDWTYTGDITSELLRDWVWEKEKEKSRMTSRFPVWTTVSLVVPYIEMAKIGKEEFSEENLEFHFEYFLNLK